MTRFLFLESGDFLWVSVVCSICSSYPPKILRVFSWQADCLGIADGKAYKSDKGLSSSKLIHGAGRPPNEYGLKYIPHKTIVGKDGTIIKNFDGVNLAADLKSL